MRTSNDDDRHNGYYGGHGPTVYSGGLAGFFLVMKLMILRNKLIISRARRDGRPASSLQLHSFLYLACSTSCRSLQVTTKSHVNQLNSCDLFILSPLASAGNI